LFTEPVADALEGDAAGWELGDTPVSPDPLTLLSAHPPRSYATTTRKKVIRLRVQKTKKRKRETSATKLLKDMPEDNGHIFFTTQGNTSIPNDTRG